MGGDLEDEEVEEGKEEEEEVGGERGGKEGGGRGGRGEERHQIERAFSDKKEAI